MPWIKKAFVVVLVCWQVVLTLLLTLGGVENRLLGAMAGMLWGLNLLWIGGVGLLSLWGRDQAPVTCAGGCPAIPASSSSSS